MPAPAHRVAPGVKRTRREEIVVLLEEGRWDLEDLRRELEIPVAVLREDLTHVQRSLRGVGRRLVVEPAHCSDCGFRLSTTSFHRPGRCPRCKGHRLEGPWLTLEG